MGHDTIECQRRRLHYRSWRRGTREADLVLGRFADTHLATFSAGQLDRYAALLEKSDAEIFDWMAGRAPVPPGFDTDVLLLLKNFNVSTASPWKVGPSD
jgi:antitoxin CptB